MGWRDELRAARAKTDAWVGAREKELRRTAAQAEARGREIYHASIKTGQNVLARTSSELRELGRQGPRGGKPQSSSKPTSSSSPAGKRPMATPGKTFAKTPQSQGEAFKDAILQNGGAALRGAIDEATFGLSDKASAAAQTLANGGLNDFSTRYDRNMAAAQASDEYDEANHGLARGLGRATGFVGSLVATGGVGAGARVGAQLVGRAPILAKAAAAANYAKRTVPMSQQGLTAMALTGGAGAGVVGQAASDLVSGKLSTLGDYAGAALGGATAGAALRMGPKIGGKFGKTIQKASRSPMTAGAIEGAATETYQRALAGEQATLEDVAQAARGGAIGARVGDIIGKYGSNSLSNRAKEKIGENLSLLKSVTSGDGFVSGPAKVDLQRAIPGIRKTLPGTQILIDLPSGRSTRADQVTSNGRVVEAKFGRYAQLTKQQKEAMRTLPPGVYRADHWLPADVGRISSLLFAAPATQIGRGGRES